MAMGRGAGKRLFDFSSQPGTRLAASNGERDCSVATTSCSPSSFNLRADAPPMHANAPVGHAPSPSTVRQAHLFGPEHDTECVSTTVERGRHLFDEHGLKLVLGSTANRVLSDDEARDFASFLGRIA
jgi:hypothetical protein